MISQHCRFFSLLAALICFSSTLLGQSTSTGAIPPPNYAGFRPPARGGQYVDPAFGTTIRRLSDAAGEGVGYVTHGYSKVSPFNADSTRVLLEKGGGVLHVRDLQGNVVRDQLQNFGILPRSNPVWSRTDPNILYFHAEGGNQIKRYNLSTNQVDTLFTFSSYGKITFSSKGDISWDGDRIPVMADGRLGFIYQVTKAAVL